MIFCASKFQLRYSVGFMNMILIEDVFNAFSQVKNLALELTADEFPCVVQQWRHAVLLEAVITRKSRHVEHSESTAPRQLLLFTVK